MAQVAEAIARYHKLLDRDLYRDLSWAEELQEKMRRHRLTESAQLLAPILRPCFISRQQLQELTRAAEHVASIIDAIEAMALRSPILLKRLHMLPAERMLASLPAGCARSNVTTRMHAYVQNGWVGLHGFEACKPAGFAYSDALSDVFLELPIVREFQNGCALSKIGSSDRLVDAVLDEWREFGGRDTPRIAVVEAPQQARSEPNESVLLAGILAQRGVSARVAIPEELEYRNGRLRARDFEIDIVIRRLLTRELLTHSDLSHPLLLAYRDHAVCVINNFRSEMTQRRDLFDLVTDEAVTERLPLADQGLIREFVPWTRVVAQKKTKYKNREVDLPEFIRRAREQLVLLPNEDGGDQRVFVGADVSASAWDQAIRIALRTPYVVQELFPSAREQFPFYRYGELQMKESEVAIHPHVFRGQLQGASATLQIQTANGPARLAIAPVLLLEYN